MGQEAYPGIYFLIAMHKSLANEFADSAGLSLYCKGGLYHWTLKAPGVNRKVMGVATSLATLFEEMERSYRSGEALVSILNKQKETKFQEKLGES